ncbi:alpha/beta fold hydrolase [Deinococcus ruber]|uniref:alpha/beta fold hydrolase n=1 Tax=Deinococcus ruber TaxID=1848197 RepID=UPI001667DB00|nr:alpha/beta fold hydrolase [Deinococcus ruber]
MFSAAAQSSRNTALPPVEVQRVVRPGVTVPGTPARLNASITVRYGAARPQRILILMPGLFGGAGSLDRLARQIVLADPETGVWAVDRRSNLLESGDQLLKMSTAELSNVAKSGLTPAAPAQVAYMKDWGLDTALRDVRAAVLEAHTLAPRVYLGGHSLGGVLTGLYAAYDFSGQPGFRDVSGLVMLDGVPGITASAALTLQQYQNGFDAAVVKTAGLNTLAANPYIAADFFSPRRASQGVAQALLAARSPNTVSPGTLTVYPATNLAAALIQVQSRYAPLPFLAVTAGHASNVNELGSLPAVFAKLLVGPLLGHNAALNSLLNVHAVAGPQNPAQPVGWANDAKAITDPLDFVESYALPTGDYTEWYFPQRLALDVLAARLNTRGTPFERLLPVIHNPEVTLPVLGISAGNGITDESDFRNYARTNHVSLSVVTVPGYAHLDVTAAISNTVARQIVSWLKIHP